MKERKNILSIAGFDSTGGAGVIADVKTFEAHNCRGFAVITANTIQTEDAFYATDWVDKSIVKKQLGVLLKRYKFDAVKVGLIDSASFLNELILLIKKECPGSKIIWDPVLGASAGGSFDLDLAHLDDTLKKVYMLTPNWNEIKALSGFSEATDGAKVLSEKCYVLLKGGHDDLNVGQDHLFYENSVRKFLPKNNRFFPKHGSGCVFSSAIAANIAKGYTINKAVLKSKRYVEFYLKSSTGLLGYHK